MRKESIERENFKFYTFGNLRFSPFGFILIIQIAAFWTVWRWLGLRVWTSAEERWSFAALAAAMFFTFFWTKSESIVERANVKVTQIAPAFPPLASAGFAASIFFTTLYAAGFAYAAAPPLARAILAMTALTFTLSVWRFGKSFHVGLYGLLLLSLPSVASAQFFLGYPLRVAVGVAVAFLLQIQGLDVWREGVCLHWGEKIVWIDAPCSGIKMLWFGLFLAAFLVCFYRLSNLTSLAVFGSAFFIILLGNIFRASALFYTEAEIFRAPPFMHEAIGVFAFVFTALGIVFAAQFFGRFHGHKLNEVLPNQIKLKKFGIHGSTSVASKIFAALFLIACVAAFFASIQSSAGRAVKTVSQNFGGFPETFDGVKIKQLPLSERESYFLEDFPGNIGRFTDGRREIIIRSVREATRKLHPASDCFRAIGYTTKPLPLKIDEGGKRWSCFAAVKRDEKLRVCERIQDAAGREWTDVSAWYWAALGEPDGNWLAYTVAERDAD